MGKQVPKVEDHPWPMQRFEAPVRDKRGKIVNPEDQESRKAARRSAMPGRRRQRRQTLR